MAKLRLLCLVIVAAVITSCATGTGIGAGSSTSTPVLITVKYIASTQGSGELNYFDGTSNKTVMFENSITKEVSLAGDASMTVRGLNSSCSMTNHDGTVSYGEASTSGVVQENTASCSCDYDELLRRNQ